MKDYIKLYELKNLKILYVILVFLVITKTYISLIFDNILYIDSDITQIVYILFGFTLVLNLIFCKKNLWNLILLSFGIVSFIFSREKPILVYSIMAMAASNIEDKSLAKLYFIFNFIFISIVVIGNLLGVIPNTTDLHYRIVDGISKIRLDFGFGNPNALFFYLMPLYTSYIFFRYEKYNWIDRLILWSIGIAVYLTTYSRTGFAVIVSGLILIEILKKIDIFKVTIIRNIFINLPLIIMVVSIFISVLFCNNKQMNTILSARPEYWSVYLNNVSLMGTIHIPEIFNLYPLDNSYIYFIGLYGIINCLVFFAITNYSLNKIIEERKYNLIIPATMFFIYGFGENILFSTSLNFTLILIMKDINFNDMMKYYKLIK